MACLGRSPMTNYPFVFYSSRVDKKITEIGEKVENQFEANSGSQMSMLLRTHANLTPSFRYENKKRLLRKNIICSMFGNLVKTNLEQQSPMKISTKIVKFIYLKIEY